MQKRRFTQSLLSIGDEVIYQCWHLNIPAGWSHCRLRAADRPPPRCLAARPVQSLGFIWMLCNWLSGVCVCVCWEEIKSNGLCLNSLSRQAEEQRVWGGGKTQTLLFCLIRLCARLIIIHNNMVQVTFWTQSTWILFTLRCSSCLHKSLRKFVYRNSSFRHKKWSGWN